MTPDESLRLERLALLIGTFIGQTAELLNQISRRALTTEEIYRSLLDINEATGIHLNEIYYRENN